MLIKKRINRETLRQGQSLVLVTLMLPVLLGMVALAIDGGYAFAQRRQMQNAADAAAVAGARALSLNTTVGSAVQTYATNNGATSYTWQQINETRTGTNGQSYTALNIQVTTNNTFNTFFARVLGVSTMTASATGRARIAPLSSASNLLPIAIHEGNFVYNQTYELYDELKELPGGFGWVNWPYTYDHFFSPYPNNAPYPQPSATRLKNEILDPSISGTRSIGEWVMATTGQNATDDVYTALLTYKNSPILLPIYDQIIGTGSNVQYRISAFGQFYLTNAVRGSSKKVIGSFMRYSFPGSAGNFSCNFCATTVKLSQ